jgi:hypothetical protein
VSCGELRAGKAAVRCQRNFGHPLFPFQRPRYGRAPRLRCAVVAHHPVCELRAARRCCTGSVAGSAAYSHGSRPCCEASAGRPQPLPSPQRVRLHKEANSCVHPIRVRTLVLFAHNDPVHALLERRDATTRGASPYGQTQCSIRADVEGRPPSLSVIHRGDTRHDVSRPAARGNSAW